METVERDYAPLGVRFFYIYKALAHPEHNGYVTPINLKERLMHIKEAQRTLGSRIPWISDTMENTLKHGLGNRPNSEFIIDPNGIIIQSRTWSDPNALRSDLERLIGTVDSPTQIQDLDLKSSPPPDTVAKGLVPRLKLPDPNMQPVKVQSKSNDTQHPHFVKLRAEATSELLQNGKGQLYLGFFMDPLHHVHWNNLTEPLKFTLDLPIGLKTDTPIGNAPKVNHPADADPREFLIQIELGNTPNPPPFLVTIDYFACDNDNTFCIPVRQVFEVSIERDQDGGRAMRNGRKPGQGNRTIGSRFPSARFNREGGSPFRVSPGMRALDLNQDRALSFEELKQLPTLLNGLDQDENGKISRNEFRAITQQHPLGVSPNY